LVRRAGHTAPAWNAQGHGAADIAGRVAPGRAIVEDQLVNIAGEHPEGHPPRRGFDPPAESRPVGQLHVDAAGPEAGDVEHGRPDPRDRTGGLTRPGRITVDLGAQWIALIEETAAEDLGRVERRDRAADVYQIVVRRQAQAGDEARLEDHAGCG